jgi:uncharacterized protein
VLGVQRIPRSFRAFAVLAALAFALLAPPAALAEGTVSVSASATLDVPNDLATFGISVSKERHTRGAALRAVSSRLREVIAAVQAIPGVGAGDVTTRPISVRKKTRGKVAVYRAAEGITVTLHQADRAGELATAAVSAGATGFSGPVFSVGDTEAAYDRALVAAFDRAKAKATALAARAGATLGGAISIEEGPSEPIETPQAVAAPKSGCVHGSVEKAPKRCATPPPPPTSPGTSEVRATVRVIFSLQ